LFSNKFTFFFGSYNFKSWYEHDHDMLWTKNAPKNEINKHEIFDFFLVITFQVIFHYYHLHYKMHNLDTFKHVRKK
jgi:hypothetical protein